jgi:hypothetical protein
VVHFVSRQRVARRFSSFPRAPARTAHCLAGQTRRLARDRCARQRIAQLPNLDAHLQRHRRSLLPGPDRLRFSGGSLGAERGVRHHRLNPGERWKILSLPDNNQIHPIGHQAAARRLDFPNARPASLVTLKILVTPAVKFGAHAKRLNSPRRLVTP